jgi:hypothetical protein
MFVIVPVLPETRFVEGYALAVPAGGNEIGMLLTNLAAPDGKLTVSTKLVFTVFVPSLTNTVQVALPVTPNAGVTVMYQWGPSASKRK